ncbi:MAG: hypothetical protein DMG89_10900 [Acidobacteria bacterium]|nr:MAG: hypothetical protein DMG89_10900 [Acidobacteriota bacterium]
MSKPGQGTVAPAVICQTISKAADCERDLVTSMLAPVEDRRGAADPDKSGQLRPESGINQ